MRFSMFVNGVSLDATSVRNSLHDGVSSVPLPLTARYLKILIQRWLIPGDSYAVFRQLRSLSDANNCDKLLGFKTNSLFSAYHVLTFYHLEKRSPTEGIHAVPRISCLLTAGRCF